MKEPKIHESVFIAEGVRIIGDVTIAEGANIWYNTVIRADQEAIVIGKHTNIQDGCVLHIDHKEPLIVGEDVTVGHGAILHSCTVGDNSLVGMGAIVLNGAVIGKNCIIGAGALVTGGTVIPDGMMAFGNPAKVRRPLTEEEIQGNKESAIEYMQLAEEHKAMQ